MRALFILLITTALAACGQDTNDFHAREGALNLVEGGRVPVVVADWGRERCTIRSPVRFSARVDNLARTIKFETKSGAVAITITVSTNWPGQLPPADELQDAALARHPGSWVLGKGTLFTGYQPGMYVDLAARPSSLVSLRIRHGFVATPQGTIELSLGANDADFEAYRVDFMQMAGSLTIDDLKPKAERQ